jgi:hypothetical protein
MEEPEARTEGGIFRRNGIVSSLRGDFLLMLHGVASRDTSRALFIDGWDRGCTQDEASTEGSDKALVIADCE